MEGFFFSFLFAFLFLIMDDPCLFWPACALTPSWISHKDYWISLNEQRSEFTHLHPASTNHLLQRPPLLLRWISHYYDDKFAGKMTRDKMEKSEKRRLCSFVFKS